MVEERSEKSWAVAPWTMYAHLLLPGEQPAWKRYLGIRQWWNYYIFAVEGVPGFQNVMLPFHFRNPEDAVPVITQIAETLASVHSGLTRERAAGEAPRYEGPARTG